jgi:hypothetical protein
MRKTLFILIIAFAASLSAQDVAVRSQPNIFTAPQRFTRGIVLDCRSLVGEAVSPSGRGKIVCDSGTFTLKASINGGSYANIGGASSALLALANTWTQANTFNATVNTSDTTTGTVTVTNTSSANFTAAIGAVATATHSYGIRAVGGDAGVFGESATGEVQSNGGFFIAYSTGGSTSGVTGQVLNDSASGTFGGAFSNGGSHAINFGMSSFAVGGPAGWFLGASTNTQPTLLIREGFGGQDASVPMIAVDDDTDAHNFAVRASGTIVHNGGVLDIVAIGAPSGACVTGSMYRRTDGTADATLYVCEATAWAAK